MDIEALRTFKVLSETKNYTHAANQLFVAQSTVTNRINELEKELNVTLLTRTNRSVKLTPEGEQFLMYAEKVIELTSSSLSELTLFHKYENHLRIGASDSIYDGHLAPLILKHRQNYPKDSLKITIGMTSHLLEQLQDDILDIVFTYLPLNKSKYICEVFCQDDMILVSDINNTEYENGITKKELLMADYLMCNFALQDVGQFIRGLFPKYHHFSLEIDDCSKIIPFLLGQNAYTFLPKDMAAPYIQSKKLRIIPLIDIKTPVINSYIIGKKSKLELWKKLFQ